MNLQEFTVYGTFQAEKDSGQLAASLRYVSFFDIRNGKRLAPRNHSLFSIIEPIVLMGILI